MKKKYIIFGVIALVVVIAIYLISTNNPINQYKKEAIEILESLKSKDISAQQAENEIKALHKKFEDTYKDKIENNVDYSCFNLHLSTLETSLYLDNIKGITNVRINEYIEQIRSK